MRTTRKAVAAALVIGAMVTILIGCGASEPVAAEPQETTEQPAAREQAADAGNTVETDNGVIIVGMYSSAGNNYNDPIGLHVEPGTTIRFVNRSGMHSSTAYHRDNGRDTRIPDGAQAWDSGLLTRRNESFEITLTVEGVYDYFCIPHEAMGHVGRIIVGNPQASPARPTDGLPQAARTALPSVEQIMADRVVRR
jgi:plastocyanin